MQGSAASAIGRFQGRENRCPACCRRSQSLFLAFAAALRRRRFARKASARRSSFEEVATPFAPAPVGLPAFGAASPASCFFLSFPLIFRPKALSDRQFRCARTAALSAVRPPDGRIRLPASRPVAKTGSSTGFQVRIKALQARLKLLQKLHKCPPKKSKTQLASPGLLWQKRPHSGRQGCTGQRLASETAAFCKASPTPGTFSNAHMLP